MKQAIIGVVPAASQFTVRVTPSDTNDERKAFPTMAQVAAVRERCCGESIQKLFPAYSENSAQM